MKIQLREMPRTLVINRLLYVLSLASVFLYFYYWIYGNYPLVGHDLAYGIPAVYETREAFWNHGVFDFEFSPFRCLGLPVFSNPSAAVWSVYHFFSLFLTGLQPLFVGTLWIVLVSFFGTLRFCSLVGLKKSTSLLLTSAWIIQGWCMSHMTAGHVTFSELLLLPLFSWILISPGRSWIMLAAAAFWTGHLFFTSGIYLILAGFPSLVITYAILRSSVPGATQPKIVDWSEFLKRIIGIGAIGIFCGSAKILGSMDFGAYYPRILPLIRVKPLRAIIYVLMTLNLTLPIEYRAIANWWFGSWESTLFIFPNFIPVLIFFWWRKWIKVPYRPFLQVFLGLITLGFFLVGAWHGPIFEKLPVVQSLHVNPRWFAMVLFPFFAAMAVLFSRMQREGTEHFNKLVVFGWVSVLLSPLLFLDQNRMVGFYQDGAGIVQRSSDGAGRLSYCYEPIFGYGLEKFPYDTHGINWANGPTIDPRCYLKSSACLPGTFLSGNPAKAEDLRQLDDYSLKDPNPWIRWLKPPSLTLYTVLFVLSVMSFFVLLKMEYRSTDDL